MYYILYIKYRRCTKIEHELKKAFNLFQESIINIHSEVGKILNNTGLDEVISKEQYQTLKIIKDFPKCTYGFIATKQGVFKTAISNRINKLKNLELISIEQGEDKREKSVLLTEKGMKLVIRTEDIIYETFNRKLSSHFSDHEIITFVKQLEKANNLITGKDDAKHV
ncbi:MarR family winged helix-turn-helix transcriptional regulator [Mammaliicoccus fleurettii]|uniref:MarR family winged helix-turn-helix transcriptional regulator n=1 Tax=Mammaliicoccus fleurettii TaxID=150056 RepID=UPI002113DC4B|nr:MarR family transcriptional regulator [Mammaliicoccus fleurettii]